MNNFIVSRLFEFSKIKKDVVAIQDNFGCITYGELWEKMSGVSEKIREQTGGKQVPVIVYQERNVDFIVSMLSCMLAGCFYIPVVKETPAYRIEKIIEDSKCQLALIDEKIENSAVKQLNVLTDEIINPSVIVEQAIIWKQHSNLAYVMYTSGTTGNPKGVIIKLSNLQNLVESFGVIIYNQIVDTVRIAVLASFGFDSSVKQIYCSLYYGHSLVIADNKIKRFSKLLQKFYLDNKIFISDGTPSNMRILVMTKRKISNYVKYFVIGGENFREDIAKSMFEIHENPIEIINVYGPTECCVDVSYYKVDKDRLGQRYIPIGVPVLNTKLRILDESGNEITTFAKKGELVVYGKQVGGGYTSGENDKFSFGQDTYDDSYRTGDFAVSDKNGQILVLGRKDNQIKKNGYRIELDEVAIQLKKIKNILDVAVRKKDFDGSEKIVAYIVSPVNVKKEKVWEEMELLIPYYMIPDMLIPIEEIPINLNGKVDEKKLTEYFVAYKESIPRGDTNNV